MNIDKYPPLAKSIDEAVDMIFSAEKPSDVDEKQLQACFETIDPALAHQVEKTTTKALKYALECENSFNTLLDEGDENAHKIFEKHGIRVERCPKIELKGCIEISLNRRQLYLANLTKSGFREPGRTLGFASGYVPEAIFAAENDDATFDHERQHIINRFIMPEKRYWMRSKASTVDENLYQEAIKTYFPSGFDELGARIRWFHDPLLPDIKAQMTIIKDEICAFMIDPDMTEAHLTEILLTAYPPISKKSQIYADYELLSTWERTESALLDYKNTKEGRSLGQIWQAFVRDYEIDSATEAWLSQMEHVPVEELSGMIKRKLDDTIKNFFPEDYYQVLVRSAVRTAFEARDKIKDSQNLSNLLAVTPMPRWNEL